MQMQLMLCQSLMTMLELLRLDRAARNELYDQKHGQEAQLVLG